MTRVSRLALAAVALTALVALSGGAPGVGAAGAAAGAPPWETAGPYPSRYDLRTALPGYALLSPVRQQLNFSTCWVMAATGSLEAATLRAEGTTRQYSPNNLADHMGSRLVFEGMAPGELAAAYYARWEGPVLERSDPYPRPGDSPAYLRAVRHVQEVLFLPRRSGPLDNDAVKWAITTYGGVDAAAYFHTQAEYKSWNGSDGAWAYYSDVSGELNHHVLCVGWDDAYPASRFLAGHRPPGDGAFLIKNSWGPDFADHGYLWVSYYDVNFGRALTVFDGVEPRDDYDAIYQHDALGRSRWVDARGQAVGAGGGQAWYASRYTCSGSGDVTAVAFYTPVAGSSYEVRVAGSVKDVTGAPAAASGVLAVAGYHTVRLERPVAVAAGDVFVAAVRVTTPGWTHPVPVEAASALIAPRGRAGQSYISADGASWTDLTSLPGLAAADVCLKAFVDDPAGAGDTRPPRAAVRGGAFRPGSVIKVRWKLSDPAFSSASAIVVLTVRNAAGKVVARRRLPAVVVGERGVWELRANWPRGSYTVRGRAYDVAGRRQPSASRAAVVVRGAAVEGARVGSARPHRR